MVQSRYGGNTMNNTEILLKENALLRKQVTEAIEKIDLANQLIYELMSKLESQIAYTAMMTDTVPEVI